MDLDRGTLARLDRRLLVGLGRGARFEMVRVPVTPAKWSTWMRYCDTAGISMGRATATLIEDQRGNEEYVYTSHREHNFHPFCGMRASTSLE